MFTTEVRARSKTGQPVAGVEFVQDEWTYLLLDGSVDTATKLCRLVEDPFVQVQVAGEEEDTWVAGPDVDQARTLLAKARRREAITADDLTGRSIADLAAGPRHALVLVPGDIAAGIRQVTELTLKAMEAGKLPIPLGEAIDAHLAEIEALLAGTSASGMPTAEPTLEREPDTTAPQSVGAEGTAEEQTQTLDEAQNAASTGAHTDNPSGSEAGPTEGAADAGAGSEEDRDPPPAEGDTTTATPEQTALSGKGKAKAKPEA